MVTANNATYGFVIDAEICFEYVIQTTLFNKDNEVVLSGSEYPLVKRIAKGLYTIRLDANGIVKDTVVLVNADSYYIIGSDESLSARAIFLKPPGITSAAPLNEKVAASSYDYYMKPAIHFASNNTWSLSDISSGSSLFLFFRYNNREHYQALRAENKTAAITQFRLLDHMRKEVLSFVPDVNIILDEENGWVAFNSMLPAGFYLLEYTGEKKRQVPVYLLEDCHTQLFLLVDGEPVFSSLRMFMQNERGFDPCDRRNMYTDLLYNRILNKNAFVEERLAGEIRMGSLPAFMLHLLYAYIAVATGSETVEQLKETLLSKVPGYHPYLNGPFPDWRAICIMGGYDDGEYKPVKGVPLINIGYQAIRKAAVLPQHKALIKNNSLNDLIAVGVLHDAAITTFYPVTPAFNDFYNLDVNVIPWEVSANAPAHSYESRFREMYEAELEIWDDFVAGYQADKASWLEYIIYEMVTKEQIRNLEVLSQKLQMSIVTIERTIKEAGVNYYRKVTFEGRGDNAKRAHDPAAIEKFRMLYEDHCKV